jgi:thiamine-phosphate diphosphorylase
MAGPVVPRLVLVLDPDRIPAAVDPCDLAVQAVAGGADGVILRARGAYLPGLAGLAAMLRDRIGDRALLLVNGDPELAIQLGMGIHLPEREHGTTALRERLGSGALIGRSVHSPESAAASAGADYLIAGHVFATKSHPDQLPLGLRRFSTIAAASPCPMLAIGGITTNRVAEVLMAGAAGIAVIDAIATAPDPEAAARDLSDALAAAGVPERPFHGDSA